MLFVHRSVYCLFTILYAVCSPFSMLLIHCSVCCLFTVLYVVYLSFCLLFVHHSLCYLFTILSVACSPFCLLFVHHSLCCLFTILYAVSSPLSMLFVHHSVCCLLTINCPLDHVYMPYYCVFGGTLCGCFQGTHKWSGNIHTEATPPWQDRRSVEPVSRDDGVIGPSAECFREHSKKLMTVFHRFAYYLFTTSRT